MQAQITCPQCQNRFMAEIYQVIDVGRNPELKQMLLSGYLNMAVCPNCRAATQVSAPVLYHDPEHELFMVHVPMELNLNQIERERLIGQLVKQTVDSLPPEQRRGYMLQPQTVLTMQTFMEKVLETEGITPEMIARQRKQAELLQTMATADKEVVDILLKERQDEIDETFFSMLKASITAAEESNQEAQALRLINLQARLMRETEIGRRLEEQQKAIHAFRQDVKKAGDRLTPKLLLEHVMANLKEDVVVSALVSMGQQALNYEFFTLLSEEIDQRSQAGDQEVATALTELRQELLDMQEAIRQQSQQMLANANETLQTILSAQDQETAVRQQMEKIDDAFMYLLSATIAKADQEGQSVHAMALRNVQSLIMNEVEQQAPPEIQLMNRLIRAESDEEQQQLLDQNPQAASPQFLQMIAMVMGEVEAAGEEALVERLRQVQRLIQQRLN
jgi:hypothetical protein